MANCAWPSRFQFARAEFQLDQGRLCYRQYWPSPIAARHHSVPAAIWLCDIGVILCDPDIGNRFEVVRIVGRQYATGIGTDFVSVRYCG